MTPTDTHLTLLRALPDEVMEKLWAHTPGHMAWITQIDGGGDAIRWVLCEKSAGNWLPCDPTAILLVAEEMHGGDYRQAWLVHTPNRDIPHEASVAADRDRQLWGYGDDPHEAALRLLLAVCGGEE